MKPACGPDKLICKIAINGIIQSIKNLIDHILWDFLEGSLNGLFGLIGRQDNDDFFSMDHFILIPICCH